MYADESGDAGLEKFDPANPVFVLCCALYRTDEYLAGDLARLSALKFDRWWHDAVVFHSYKIRKKVFPFQALKDEANRASFYESVSAFFAQSTVTLVAAAIDKQKLKQQYRDPDHPYNMALQFCLERVYLHIHGSLRPGEIVTFVFEKRGVTEDKLLAEKFDLFCQRNACNAVLPFRACFAAKEENITGLQVADLAAYPISRYVESKNEERPDWVAIKPRIRSGRHGIDGYGLKVFP